MGKRMMAIVLTLTLLFSVTACTGKTPEPVPTTSATVDVVTTTEPSETEVTTTESVATTKPTTVTTTTKTTVATTTKTTETTTTTSRTYQFLPTTTYPYLPKPVKNQLGDGNAVYYELTTREDFYTFVQKPSQEYIDTHSWAIVEVPHIEEEYMRVTSNAVVTKEMVNLADSAVRVKVYLREHGVSVGLDETIVETAIFTTLGVPVVLWVKSDQTSYYIVRDTDNEEFVCYTADSFQEKYFPRPATLFVNGKQVASGEPVLLHHDHADIPFVGVLEALGAKVSWTGETTANIVLNGSSYVLDTTQKVTCIDAQGSDRLNTGMITPRLSRKARYELFLDTKSAKISLSLMGIDTKITLDRVSNRVILEAKFK